MARFDGILLCSDFDGTMFCDDKISEENSQAIKYFQDNGGIFTVVSGRFPDYFRTHTDRFEPNTFLIGLNGAVIFDQITGQRIYYGVMPEGSLSFASDILFEYSEIKTLGLHSFDTYYPYNRESLKDKVSIEELSKIIFIIDEKDSDRMAETIKKLADQNKFSVVRSWINGIELLNAENTKGRSVRRLARMLGSRAEKIVCVGDYENDISMICEADIGYAVGNALPSVKSVADRITVSYNEHAIEKIICEL